MLKSTVLILAVAVGQAEAQESPSYKHLELLEPMIDAHVPVAISDETLELKPSVVQVRMADGTRLAARVYKPQGEGPFPAIVVRTPYSATFGSRWVPDTARRFAKWGYATVVQDCRGTGDSEGEWEPFGNEHTDGEETLAWTLKQPWCNGKLATFGGSYTGFTQWAAAPGAGSSISAMVSAVPALDWYEICYVGGAYRLRVNRVWDAAMARPKSGQAAYINMDFNGARTIKFNNGTWEDVFRDLPLRTWDKAFDIKVPWAQEVVEHPSIEDYWKRSTTSNRANKIATPNELRSIRLL